MHNKLIPSIIILLLLISSSCSIPFSTGSESDPEENGQPIVLSLRTPIAPSYEISQLINSVEGGELWLSNEVKLIIPPQSLSTDTLVTIKKIEHDSRFEAHESMISLGDIYEIDFGSEHLEISATLNIPFNPTLLPSGVERERVFLSYFDTISGKWSYAGGNIDKDRNILTIEMNQSSLWSPKTWNWQAWIDGLEESYPIRVLEWIQYIDPIAEDCLPTSEYVRVDSNDGKSIIYGCVDSEAAEESVLRLVNPSSIPYEIRTIFGGDNSPSARFLFPGENLTFSVSTFDLSPLIIAAEVTEKSGMYLITSLITQILPGANQAINKSEQISCLARRISDDPFLPSAAQALLVEKDTQVVTESLSNFLLDPNGVNSFITAAKDCGINAATTWTVPETSQITIAISAISSTIDAIISYLTGNSYSEVTFTWKTPDTQELTQTTKPPNEYGIIQILTFITGYLRYDPQEWEARPVVFSDGTPFTNEDGEPIESIYHLEMNGCVFQHNEGRGVPEDWSTSQKIIQLNEIELERKVWTHIPTGNPVLAVYRPNIQRTKAYYELVIGANADLCLAAAERVLEQSEDLILDTLDK